MFRSTSGRSLLNRIPFLLVYLRKLPYYINFVVVATFFERDVLPHPLLLRLMLPEFPSPSGLLLGPAHLFVFAWFVFFVAMESFLVPYETFVMVLSPHYNQRSYELQPDS